MGSALGVEKLVALIYLYLDDLVSGRDFVKSVDELVASNQLVGFSDEFLAAFDDLHEKLALCVWDARTYEENPGVYISESEMKDSVRSFISHWGKFLAEHI